MSPTQLSELPPPGDDTTLYLVDLTGYIFRAYHAIAPLSSPSGEPTHAVYGTVAMLRKLLKERAPKYLAVTFDSKGPTFRKQADAEYKANRPPPPEDLSQQITRVIEVVEALRIPALQCEGFEADDIIATVTDAATAAGYAVVIISADKDLLQLIKPRVWMLDTMRDKVYGAPEIQEKWGVTPPQMIDLLALMGDSSDNIPGVPSVGAKTAAQLVQTYGSIDGIYANLEAVTQKRLKANLTEHRADAYRSRDLVTLRHDVPITFDVHRFERQAEDRDKVVRLFTELGFKRLLEEQPATSTPAREAAQPSIARVRELTEVADCVARLRKTQRVAVCAASDGPAAVWIAFGEGDSCCVELGATSHEASSDKALAETLCNGLFAAASAGVELCTDDLKRLVRLALDTGHEFEPLAFDVALANYVLRPDEDGHTPSELAGRILGHGGDIIGADGARNAQLVLELAPRLRGELVEKGLLKLLTEIELPLAKVLAKVEAAGVTLDVAFLAQLSTSVRSKLETIEKRCYELAGKSFNLGSPRQLETILFDELRLPVVKRTKTARSTDHQVLEELSSMHPLPAAILEHRSLAKLLNTYLDVLPTMVSPETGRIHTQFNQTVAATGRLSSKDPNLQNIPIKTELGREIRKAFVPERGWVMVSADYSQIELRLLAHLSGDKELISAFKRDEDVHTHTAMALFGVEAKDVTREMRGRAKTVNFAVTYGQGQFALARSLRIEQREAARYIAAFFERYAGVRAYFDGVLAEARRTGAVRTLLGRVRPFPDLNSQNRVLRQQAERAACNSPIQGSAADILKLAMIAIDRDMVAKRLQSRMLLTVHDELVFEAPKAERDELAELVRAHMCSVVTLDVPLVVEVGSGASWGEAH